MMTLKCFIALENINTEEDLLEIAEKIWSLGDIDSIAQQLDTTAFNAFVMMNIIGHWKGDGWSGIIEGYDFLPFIENVLKVHQLDDLTIHYKKLIELFPIDPFSNKVKELFCDHHNFLINPRFKSQQKNDYFKLLEIDFEVRKTLSKQYHELLVLLDDESEQLWSYDAPNEAGWGIVIDYIRKNVR